MFADIYSADTNVHMRAELDYGTSVHMRLAKVSLCVNYHRAPSCLYCFARKRNSAISWLVGSVGGVSLYYW